MVSVGLLIMDGDVAPQNAVIHYVKMACQRYGASAFYGINDGLELLAGGKKNPTPALVKDFTGRDLPIYDYQCRLTAYRPNLGDTDAILKRKAKKIATALNDLRISHLVILSGIRGISYLNRIGPCLTENGINYVVINKSINCDVGWRNPSSTETQSPIINIGYPTAASIAGREALRIRKGAYNQDKIFVAETFGGITGWLTSATNVWGAQFVLIPEMFRGRKFESVMGVTEDQVVSNHKLYSEAVLALSEAVPTSDKESETLELTLKATSEGDIRSYSNVKLAGKAKFLAARLNQRLDRGSFNDIPVSETSITYECRWGRPSRLDIRLAELYSTAAVRNLFTERFGTMPFLSMDRLKRVGPDDDTAEMIGNGDIETISIKNCVLQPVPEQYIEFDEKHKKLGITSEFQALLHKIIRNPKKA